MEKSIAETTKIDYVSDYKGYAGITTLKQCEYFMSQVYM